MAVDAAGGSEVTRSSRALCSRLMKRSTFCYAFVLGLAALLVSGCTTPGESSPGLTTTAPPERNAELTTTPNPPLSLQTPQPMPTGTMIAQAPLPFKTPSQVDQKLGFLSNEEGSFRLYVANADGSQRRVLTTALQVDETWGIAASNDGTYVAIIGRSQPGEPWAMYSVNVETGSVVRLANVPGEVERTGQSWFAPLWSDLDQSVLFLSMEDDAADTGGCFQVPRDGGEPRVALVQDECIVRLALAELPNSEYATLVAGSLMTFNMSADAGEYRLLHEIVPRDDIVGENSGFAGLADLAMLARGFMRPMLSPDGTQLAYAFNGKVFVIPADGGTPRVVWEDDDAAVGILLWSQDGRRLIAGEVFTEARGAIREIDLASGEVRTVLGGEAGYDAVYPVWVGPKQ